MNNLEKIGENLYSFKICLADTKVDSDYERFTISALDKMADLYRGRTGFMEVQGKSYKPRISQAWIDLDYRNDYEPKLYAIACCIINSDDVKTVDEYLDTHKEISISCSVLSRRCSICGVDKAKKSCKHCKGKNYQDGFITKTCVIELSDITDVYEWAFVEKCDNEYRYNSKKQKRNTKGY